MGRLVTASIPIGQSLLKCAFLRVSSPFSSCPFQKDFMRMKRIAIFVLCTGIILSCRSYEIVGNYQDPLYLLHIDSDSTFTLMCRYNDPRTGKWSSIDKTNYLFRYDEIQDKDFRIVYPFTSYAIPEPLDTICFKSKDEISFRCSTLNRLSRKTERVKKEDFLRHDELFYCGESSMLHWQRPDRCFFYNRNGLFTGRWIQRDSSTAYIELKDQKGGIPVTINTDQSILIGREKLLPCNMKYININQVVQDRMNQDHKKEQLKEEIRKALSKSR